MRSTSKMVRAKNQFLNGKSAVDGRFRWPASTVRRRWLAHLVRVPALVVVLAACAQVRAGGSGSESESDAGAGSRRSGFMVYTSVNKTLRVNMATGETSTLFTTDLNLSFVGTGVGPNGEVAVAYNTSTTGSTSRLTVLRPDGSTERSTTFDYTIEGPPRFSPDGTKIAFRAGSRSGATLSYFTQVVSREGESLYFFKQRTRPGWMPDGRLVLASEDGKADLSISGQTPQEPLTAIPNSSNTASFSVHPNGKSIAFSRGLNGGARHIYVMNLDGSETEQVTTSTASEENRVVFSPDGNELLVTTAGCLAVTDTGQSAGDVDRDLIHVIAASSRMVDIRGLVTSGASSRLLDASGATRCSNNSPSWR